MKQNITLVSYMAFISILSLLSLKALNQDKELKELKIRLDEQELLNKIGKELITSKLNIR